MSIPELPEGLVRSIERYAERQADGARRLTDQAYHHGYRDALEAALELPRELAALVGELEPETWRIMADACRFYADDRKRIVARRSFEQGPEFAESAHEMIAALDRATAGARAVARSLERAR